MYSYNEFDMRKKEEPKLLLPRQNKCYADMAHPTKFNGRLPDRGGTFECGNSRNSVPMREERQTSSLSVHETNNGFSNLLMQTCPSSRISSIGSPAADETSNCTGSPYPANHSPSQLSNDSGFSGDYQKPLSIRVSPPRRSDSLNLVGYSGGYNFDVNGIRSSTESSADLLQPVSGISTQCFQPQQNYSIVNDTNINGSGSNNDTPYFSYGQGNTGYTASNEVTTGSSYYNGCENFNPNNYWCDWKHHGSYKKYNFDASQCYNGTEDSFATVGSGMSPHVDNLPNGEELSHIVDQVLNSIDEQFSPPLNQQFQLSASNFNFPNQVSSSNRVISPSSTVSSPPSGIDSHAEFIPFQGSHNVPTYDNMACDEGKDNKMGLMQSSTSTYMNRYPLSKTTQQYTITTNSSSSSCKNIEHTGSIEHYRNDETKDNTRYKPSDEKYRDDKKVESGIERLSATGEHNGISSKHTLNEHRSFTSLSMKTAQGLPLSDK